MGAISLLNVGVAAAPGAAKLSTVMMARIRRFMVSSPGSPGLWHSRSRPSSDAVQVLTRASRRSHSSNRILLLPDGAYRNRRCDYRSAPDTEPIPHEIAERPPASPSLRPDARASVSD